MNHPGTHTRKTPFPVYLLVAACCLVTAWLSADEHDGLLELGIEPETGAIYLHLDRFPAEYLYVPALESGAGSNDLGLDRGQLDRSRWIRFERYGNRVLMLEPNLKFRADTNNTLELRTVSEAFAQSVLAGFAIENPEEDTVKIDLSPLLLSDVTRITDQITGLEQGNYELDPERSAIDTKEIRNYPQNTLIPVILTFQGSEAGEFIKDVTPTPDSLTVRVNHQFIQLPESDFQVRQFHPRSGFFALEYRDYAAALNEGMDKRFIYRHHLEPGETLTYYVDNGAPEPVRSALLEGASWWADAFQAAGFENGFRVEVLPADADPLDVRYNVIQWIHRSTRGWSFGGRVSDPRTGQILKGHVSLGSLRVRQDQLIAEALTAPFTSKEERAAAAQEFALARLRQLSAHEVGHTLGIRHNFAASFSGDASVMDYPHPNLYLDDQGSVGLDRAYQSGISPWDTLAIRYGYTVFPADEEDRGLHAILNEAESRGIAFITDEDARVPGSAHPAAHLWDNGQDVLARLGELLKIRQTGLDNFSPAVISDGTALFDMERRLVPVYLLHRYQVEASAKLLGGLYYDYRLKGESAPDLKPVAKPTQEMALKSLVSLLRPEALALPQNLRYLIPPPVAGYRRDREFFTGSSGASFDQLSPARAGADLVIRELLQPQRLARLTEQQAFDPELPGIPQLIQALLKVSWDAPEQRDSYLQAIQEEIDWRVIRGLMDLSADSTASDLVRASGTATLIRLNRQLERKSRKRDAHAKAAAHEIRSFLDHQPAEAITAPDTVPPGSPIG